MAKIYRWHSELLKQYGTGHLIAMGDRRVEAEQVIRDGFDEWRKDRFEWLRPDHDADDGAEVERMKALLEADLAKEPDELECLYINGSE